MKERMRVFVVRYGKKVVVLTAITAVVKFSLLWGGVGVALVITISTVLIDTDWEAL